MGNPLKRVVVVGCCGAGKSVFSGALARQLGVPPIERDTLGTLGSDAYHEAVAAVLSTTQWVFDGPPYFVDELVYSQAQCVLWLDFPRSLVVVRAARRALWRTLFPEAHGRWRQWIAPGGPRFAQAVYADRKREFSQLQSRPELTGKVVRIASPREAQAWLNSLAILR